MHLAACRCPASSSGFRQAASPCLRPAPSHAALRSSRPVSCRSSGKEALGGWLDLAALVTSGGNSSKTAYDGLATSIGRDIYVDVGGWHLFLRDLSAAPNLKMSQALATKFGPTASDRPREADVEAVLKQIPVKLGGGKTTVSLLDVMNSSNVRDLTRILEDYARNK